MKISKKKNKAVRATKVRIEAVSDKYVKDNLRVYGSNNVSRGIKIAVDAIEDLKDVITGEDDVSKVVRAVLRRTE